MQLITIQFAVGVRKDYTPLRVYVGCVWVVIYVKYITYEGILHNTLALDVDTVQETCILWAQMYNGGAVSWTVQFDIYDVALFLVDINPLSCRNAEIAWRP